MQNFEHVPVMSNEIKQLAQSCTAQGVMIDATLGGGGHTKILLDIRNQENLIAFDRDINAIKNAETLSNAYTNRLEIIHSGFDQIGNEIRKRNLEGKVSIVLFDLGVSSHQLDIKERGFTYRHDDAPLDMRMDSSEELTASIIVNEYEEAEIARILKQNGDEKFAKQIAKSIVESRPIENAGQLVDAIRKAMPNKFQRLVHPAKRTFQALRIEVNKELDQLKVALDESVHLLAPGGRVLVLSYHSGEDKIAKDIFKKYMTTNPTTKDGRVIPLTGEVEGYESNVRLIKIPINKKPTQSEINDNPRSKSARLRAVELTNFDQASGM
ncbi:MAG: 16S rRNA (cytosine(1402)-N(4))-methyltransferase RsmH [Acidimicrobiia bacterium]